MFLKKSSHIDDVSNVRFINGQVSFSSVGLNVHCFEVDGVLIDTGSHTLLPQFKNFFAQMDVDQVMITHYHEDHTGGAGFLQKKFGLPLYMNEMTIDDCARKADYPLYRKIFWGRRRPFQAEPIAETFTSRNAVWDVIETPGHAKDHLSFLNRQTGQLFSGDLYVHPQTKVILREESMPMIMQSIEKVLEYDFGEMFCCHAGYVKDGRQALTEKLNYLRELEEKIHSLHQQGCSAPEIQSKIFKKKYPITFFSMGEWNTMHLITSFLNGNNS